MGYLSDYSRSERAAQAESDGRLPASRLADRIRRWFPGCAAADVASVLRRSEWHHTSARYNETDYYDLIDFAACETRRRLREQIASRKSAPVSVNRHSGVTVRWLEWGGTRKHPRATERTEVGCSVETKGTTATVTFADGRRMVKRIGARGFSWGEK